MNDSLEAIGAYQEGFELQKKIYIYIKENLMLKQRRRRKKENKQNKRHKKVKNKEIKETVYEPEQEENLVQKSGIPLNENIWAENNLRISELKADRAVIAHIFSGSLFHAIDKRNKGDLLKEDPDCGRTIEQGRRGIWEGWK